VLLAADDEIVGNRKIDPTLTFRRACREGICGSCAMNMDGTNWLACTRFISDLGQTATIYFLANTRVAKDLVPDQTHLFAQHALVEPCLQTKSPTPEKERLPASGGLSTEPGNETPIVSLICISDLLACDRSTERRLRPVHGGGRRWIED